MAKVALLVGVSEYKPGLNPLPAAVKDIEAMQRVLLAPDLGGFDEVKPLKNPDSQIMQEEFEMLFSDRSKGDLAVLFFSGHGIKDDSGRLYFAARNTKKNAKNELIRSTAVPASFLHDVMHGSRAKRQVIILDCCFSGAFDQSRIARDDSSVDLQGQLGAEGRVVLTSSSSTQYALEEQGADLSIYTRYLVEGIETGAGDLNGDGKIFIQELHEYTADKVRETAPSMTPKIIVIKDTGFNIVLAKAKIADPRLRYRREVEQYASRGEISQIGRTILDRLSTQLGLSTEEAAAIEAEVLYPSRQKLENVQHYRQVFAAFIEDEYPPGEAAQAKLKKLREDLGLREDDVSIFEAEETAKKTAVVQEAYSEKLQRYKKEFRIALQAEYPFSEHVMSALRNFQQSLELKDKDIEEVEEPLIRQKEAEQKRQAEQKEYQQKLERYEQEFRKALKAYPFSEYLRSELRNFQQSLELKDKDIEQVEDPLIRQKEYQQKLERYEQEFRKALRAGYPCDEHVRSELRNFQQSLELKDKDIEEVEEPLIRQKEAEQKRQAEQKEYQQKLERYEQYFRKEIEARYPLSPLVKETLNQFQQSLGLNDQDANRIEQPIMEREEAAYQRKQQEEEKLRQQQAEEKLQQRQGELAEYQRNLQLYKQELSRVIQEAYPLDTSDRERLRNFQQAWKLKDEDVAPILQAREAEYQRQRAEKLRQQQAAEQLRQKQKIEEHERQQIEQRKQQQTGLWQEGVGRYQHTFSTVLSGLIGFFTGYIVICLVTTGTIFGSGFSLPGLIFGFVMGAAGAIFSRSI